MVMNSMISKDSGEAKIIMLLYHLYYNTIRCILLYYVPFVIIILYYMLRYDTTILFILL